MSVQRKMVRTYLDEVAWGTEEFLAAEEKKSRKERRKLPAGCRSSVLYGDIMRIAWPSLLEQLLTSLVGMADMIMVGSMVNGDDAISAVSLANQPKFIFVSLMIALNVGVTAAVARDRGAQRHDSANRTLRQGLFMSFLVCVFASVMGITFSRPLIRFMATGALSEEIIDMGTAYLQIQMAGFMTMGITATLTAALRGVGNSRSPMIYNITANLVNIVGNYLLINGHFGFPALGVAGASLATVIGQAVGLIIALRVVGSGNHYFHVTLPSFLKGFRPDMTAISRIVKVGIPSLIEQAIMRVGIILFSRQVASLGQPYFATHQICMNIQSLSFMLGMGLSVSSTTLVGQSLGKKRPDMAEHYSRRTMQVGLAMSVVMGMFFAFLGKYIVGFYSTTPAVIAASIPVMAIVGLLQPAQIPQFILSGSLRGAGATKATAVITLVGVLLMRPVVAHIAINILQWGLIGAWVAIAFDQVSRSALVIAIYNAGKWKKIQV
ncbi:MAG: MATE family efflux transporter [Solobacterium sp.]|nr:MATE family efflux transporter [Solobacterium sp.]